MLSHRKPYAVVLLLAFCPGALIASAQNSNEEKSLGDAARQLRTKKAPTKHSPTTTSVSTSPTQPASQPVATNPPEVIPSFMDDIRMLARRQDFAALDKMAETLRSSKARFPGGGWKLTRFYEALTELPNEAAASESDWQSHLGLFHRWMAARPESITARVALAQAYLGYAWAARGSGYSNTVTEQGWQQFGERTTQAGKVLMEAAALPSKCPHWYAVMQRVAQAAGADKGQLRSVFEKAIEFEPEYFAYYQLHANALLPKWAGEPGDTEAFAEESYRRVGGKKGAHIYFEIASNLCGRCGDFSAAGFSWQRIQEGFAAMEELYGVSPLKLNRFAFLAATYGDKDVAARIFLRIGSEWDYSIWGSRARFDSQRNWARLPASAPSSPPQLPPIPQPSGRVAELLQLAVRAGQEGHWGDSNQRAQQAIDLAKSLPGTAVELGRGYLVLASNEQQQNHTSEAEAMLERALSIVAEKAGPESIELAMTLDDAARIEQGLNGDARAEADLRRAVAIREKTNGPTDMELVVELMRLGDLCRRGGRANEAVEFFQRAISTREAVENDDLAITLPLEELGTIYQSMGRNGEAESSFLWLLRVMELRLGTNSPTLVQPLSKLAGLYHSMGKTASEQRILERLQAIRSKVN